MVGNITEDIRVITTTINHIRASSIPRDQIFGIIIWHLRCETEHDLDKTLEEGQVSFHGNLIEQMMRTVICKSILIPHCRQLEAISHADCKDANSTCEQVDQMKRNMNSSQDLSMSTPWDGKYTNIKRRNCICKARVCIVYKNNCKGLANNIPGSREDSAIQKNDFFERIHSIRDLNAFKVKSTMSINLQVRRNDPHKIRNKLAILTN